MIQAVTVTPIYCTVLVTASEITMEQTPWFEAAQLWMSTLCSAHHLKRKNRAQNRMSSINK